MSNLLLWGSERWQAAETAHHRRVDALLAGHLERAGRAQRHPGEDFLFRYYSLRPARLRRWHPGAGIGLLGPAAEPRAQWREHVRVTTGQGTAITLDVETFWARRGPGIRAVRDLLAATRARPAHLSCFCLHEWAMVYRLGPDDVRHPGWPLRLGHAGSDAVVDGHPVRCTHYDAFRHFAPQAVARNEFRPTRADQPAWEQPGCLHATMDLYKWAYKLSPAISSDLVADALALAVEARTVDVRASPYDLRALGYAPIPIETEEGKATFVREQQRITDLGIALRARLLAAADALLDDAG